MRHQRVRNYLLGIVLCTFISAGGLSVSAQTPTPSPSPTPQTSSTSTLEHDFFKNILRDQKAIWTAPFHLHGDDAYWLAPITLATVIANEYHDHRAVEIAAYGLASAVSISRFTGHNHFLSDVLVGSALGYGIGRYVYKTHHVKTSAFGGEEEEEEQSFNHSRRW